MDTKQPFWVSKSLSELTPDEWESLCDGCGKCCLHKIEDEESGELFYTSIACRQLDLESGGCRNYTQRTEMVPDCVCISADKRDVFEWLPGSCAYRLVAEGKPLPAWHHLVCGDRQRIHREGESVIAWATSEEAVAENEWDDFVLEDFEM